ncbi:MAG TPA: SUF system Fe-S cluster assembly protein [Candidatus Krumholzibacteria bacterium]|jgi:FeS assembly SUF system protein|nr:SUF system Fe-S cluster assembly protein [Candidatus Krumholzibacteria bacterium]
MMNVQPESNAVSPQTLREKIIEALKTCYDPEIPIDIWELGLIYDIDIASTNDVIVTMTLTTPHCPAAETLPVDVENKVSAVEGVASVKIELTWEPAWSPQMMSEAARLELNL